MTDALSGIVCEEIWRGAVRVAYYKSDHTLTVNAFGRFLYVPIASMKGAEIYEHLSVEGLVDVFRPIIHKWLVSQ